MQPDRRRETIAGLYSAMLRLGRATEGMARSGAGALGLTPAQLETLRFAAETRPDVATIRHLARVLGVRHPTAIGIVTPLETRGLVERRPHPYDGRQQSLALTATGRDVLDRAGGLEQSLADILASLDDDALARVEAGIATLVDAMQRAGQVVVSAPCAGCVHFRPDLAPGSERPHHCVLIARSLTDPESRMNCPEHKPALAST